MAWKPDVQHDMPVFRQIARHFEEEILSGKLIPDEALPPERSLAKSLGVNRSTITAAYDELRAIGLVKSMQGSGTRVSENLWNVAVRPAPSWHQYISDGLFRPTLPLLRCIREASLQENTINFARGEMSPDLFPVQKLNDAMHSAHLTGALGYSDSKGLLSLRQALTQHLKEQVGIATTPSELLITSGAQQAIHLITSCLLQPGDAIALECPSYAYSLSLFTSAGLRLFPIPMDDDGLIPESIPGLVKKHRIRMLFVNPTFQNPTGTTLTVDRRQKLLRVCESLRLPIVEDDPYGALNLDDRVPPPSLAEMANGCGQVIYLGSLSETVAPALRIGWVIGPTGVIDRLADAKYQMDFGTSIIPQRVAQEFLTSGAWYDNVLSLRRVLTQRRDTMVAAMEETFKEDMMWTIPQGSYHLWCKLYYAMKDTDLLNTCIRHGVVVVPGGVYGAEKGFIRLTYARVTKKDITEGVARLRLALQDLVV